MLFRSYLILACQQPVALKSRIELAAWLKSNKGTKSDMETTREGETWTSVRVFFEPIVALTCQMQDRVRPFRVLFQGLDGFGSRQYLELDFPAMSLVVHLFHHRQRSGSGADHKPPALLGYLLLYRERCMPKPVTEPFGRFFLALADAATVDHDVIRVSRSVNADRAK